MSITRHSLLALVPLFGLACGGDKSDDDSGSATTTAGEGEGEGEGSGGDAGGGEGEGESGGEAGGEGTGGGGAVAPTVVTGTVACLPNSSGPSTVALSAEVDDPQGADTIDSLGSTVRVEQSGVLLTEGAVACGMGACVWSAVDDTIPGINCTTGPDLDYILTVLDEDGNTSEPTNIEWSG